MSTIRPAITLFLLLTLVTGVAYPLAVTGAVQALFPAQANGSIVSRGQKAVGSSLIGQEFNAAGHFWGRLSATSPVAYSPFNADKSTGSSGSNLSSMNPDLIKNGQARIDALRAADAAAGYTRPASERVPVDLVTSSASGLDPHISLAAAEYQIGRVAKARAMSEDAVRAIVRGQTTSREFGVLGEPVVNVLNVNLALDGAK